MITQWIQGQEAKLQQMNQLQQKQDKHLGQTLKSVHLQMSKKINFR